MRLAFMGTPEFAKPALCELVAAGHEIVCVYTRAPQRRGRGRRLQASPVGRFAEKNRLAVRTPKNFQSTEEIAALEALDLDAAVVVAYGLILPEPVLRAPRLGCFNLHASLLPRWRGAAPIARAIMAGDEKTGVQVMRMEKGLDTGPIILSETVDIAADDTAGSLAERLARIGAGLLPRALAAVERGVAVETPQSAEGVRYAEKISPAETRIDWRRPADEIDRMVRGLSPHPGAWFEAPTAKGRERIKALLSRPAPPATSPASDERGLNPPGRVCASDGGLVIACGQGAVEILRLQRAGKSEQGAAEFRRGFPIAEGAILPCATS